MIWSGKTNICQQESKYKFIRPAYVQCWTYAAEIRASTITTQQLLRTTEMRIIRAIQGKALRDRIRSKDLREINGIRDIVEWINVR